MSTKNNPGPIDCYAKAAPDEPMFVLLGRDPLASTLVMMWAEAHARLSGSADEKYREALRCSKQMLEYAEAIDVKKLELADDAIANVIVDVANELCDQAEEPSADA